MHTIHLRNRSTNNQIGKIVLDSVALFRYMQGTVKNWDFGPAPHSEADRPELFWEVGVGRKLVLVGGEKPQMRKASGKSITQAKQSEFLSVLAETCNVTRACEGAGVSVTHAYRMRKTDAAFRAGWLEAISIAYQRLELVLLDRAFNGTEKLVKRRDGSEERMTEYSNQLGLTLLKMHRDTVVEAATEFQPDQIEELRERIFKKMQRLKARDAQEAEQDA